MNRFFIVLIFAFSLSSLLGIQATEGKWIAPSDANHPNTWMTFRKDIILPKRPEKAVAQIAVDSKYWLWINGQLAVFEEVNLHIIVQAQCYLTSDCGSYTARKPCYYHISYYLC